MVFLIAPVAVAGYMHYKKLKAEREAKEAEQASIGENNNGSDDSDDSNVHEQNDTPASIQGASQTNPKPLGPLGKFMLFCENLEKEVQKAQERKRREVMQQALDEAREETFGSSNTQKIQVDLPDVPATSTLDSTDTTISEEDDDKDEEEVVVVEESTSSLPECQEKLPDATIDYSCRESKKEVSSAVSFVPCGIVDEHHRMLVKSMGSTPNRPRIATE